MNADFQGHFEVVAFVEGMFEVMKRYHQAGGQARATGFGAASTGNHIGRAKQVRVFNFLASAHLAGKEASIFCQAMRVAKTSSR